MHDFGDFELQVPSSLSDESRIVVDTDALITDVPATGDSNLDALLFGARVNRRELLQIGGLGALGSVIPTSATYAQEQKWDPTVKLGYIPEVSPRIMLVGRRVKLDDARKLPHRWGVGDAATMPRHQ